MRRGKLTDIKGNYIQNDTLFLHIYDYWTNFHHPSKKFFWWNETLLSKLERYIRRKWVQTLLDVDVLIDRIKENNERLNPTSYLEQNKKYFESLLFWKETHEKDFLAIKFVRFRHTKILGTAKPITG